MWSPVEVVTDGCAGASEAPCARGKHAAAIVGGYVYVVGGRGAGGNVPLRDCWRYHIGSGRWERLRTRGEPPPALQEHSATTHAHRIYVFGGEASLSAETPLWVFDTETLIWRKLPGTGSVSLRRRARPPRAPRPPHPAAPSGRRGHSAHALNDCLLIYGGYKDLRGSTNELWAFHYESESWQQVRTVSAGPARHRHAAALHDARLYVHAGQCDLRACSDLWFYDTMSRTWTQVRTPARLSPGPRCGHAGLRAGAHLYIFGGEADGHPTNELWRFHFATETWERMAQSLKWPAPRVDACALLLAGVAARVRSAAAGRGGGGGGGDGSGGVGHCTREEPPGLLREISKLSAFHIRRAARCSYSVLAGERDSTESLPREPTPALAKSRSAYVIEGRQPADGDESPRAGDLPDREMAREPTSVPDFSDVAPPASLIYLDSDEEPPKTMPKLPKSASVRFTREAVTITREEESELSTSDYASAERVNRLSGASLGFSNPHYLGPDVRALGAALTPDSGVSHTDIELTEIRRRPTVAGARMALLLVGGREPSHPALMHSPLALWTYNLG